MMASYSATLLLSTEGKQHWAFAFTVLEKKDEVTIWDVSGLKANFCSEEHSLLFFASGCL